MNRTKKHLRVHSANSTNLTTVKDSAGWIGEIVLGNSGAGAAFFKLYDKASNPTLASNTPFATLMVPAGRTFEFEICAEFANGIAYAITGAATDTDTTAVSAAQVTGFLVYN